MVADSSAVCAKSCYMPQDELVAAAAAAMLARANDLNILVLFKV